jgi:stage V sporulation protein SpoVS
MSLAADRNTPSTEGELIPVPVATATTIYAGSLVAANATGFAVPGAVATTLTYLGRAEEQVVNAGANGAKTVLVRRKQAFKWLNHGADLVVQADLGKTCYIVDDQTVAKTTGGATRSAAGRVIGIDSDGVWVE